jgi:hypothetical protein
MDVNFTHRFQSLNEVQTYPNGIRQQNQIDSGGDYATTNTVYQIVSSETASKIWGRNSLKTAEL